MHIQLREGNPETFFFKCFVNQFVHLEKDVPVIGSPYPRPYNDDDRTVSHFMQSDKGRCRFVQDPAVVSGQIPDDRFGFVKVISVRDGKVPVHTTEFLAGIIGNYPC